jgi:hypothetical protein
MELVGKEKMVTVCGKNCTECSIFNGDIKETAKKLSELLQMYGFTKETMELIPESGWYGDFETGLDWCQKKINCSGCRSENRLNPDCELRNCCIEEKKLSFCFECTEFPCNKIKNFEENFFPCLENLMAIKKIGVSQWLDKREVAATKL